MNQIYVILRSSTSGGTGTLSIRIGTWLVSKGYGVVYICQEINDVNNVRTMESKGIKVFCWKYNEIAEQLTTIYGRDQRYRFLTYSLEEFVFAERLKSKLEIESNFWYVTSNWGINKREIKNQLAGGIVRRFYGSLIRKLLNNNNILFPTEKTVEMAQDYYRMRIEIGEDKLYRLPMYVNDIDDNQMRSIVEKKRKLESFNLIAISRADFPLRGYVLGLIDDFQDLLERHNNLRLTIITFGEKVALIRKRLGEKTTEVQSKTRIIENVPYEKLGEYFCEAHLNLGIGTSVLDAANYFVPTVLVKELCYSNWASGFFCTSSTYLCARHDDQTTSATEYIEAAVAMDEAQYLELCKESYFALREKYGIDYFMSRFIKEKNETNKTVISRLDLLVLDIISAIRVVLRFFKKVIRKN